MLNDAGLAAEQRRQFCGIRNWTEVGIQDQVVLIGFKIVSIFKAAGGYRCSQRVQIFFFHLTGKCDDFNRHRPICSQLRREFAFVHDNDVLAAGLRHHFFP